MLLLLGKSRLALATALAILPLTQAPALADTYQITFVLHTQDEAFVGIDDAGDYVVNLTNGISISGPPGPCGAGASTCFETVYSGSSTPVYTTTAPILTYDNGTPCAPTLFSGLTPQKGVCNNGHTVVGGMGGATDSFGVWDGPDPIADLLLFGATFDGGYMNASGDVVFIDGHDDELIAATDLSSPRPIPEPGGLLLLGTGFLSFIGAIRRRIRS